MAISPPNYTQVPNTILDRMHEMTPAEVVVLMAICRLTFGWHKSEEVLTLSQLERMTGLSRPTVLSGINAAERHTLLERTKVQTQSQSYRLLIASGESEPVKNLDRSTFFTGQDSLPQPVKEIDRQPVKNVDLHPLKKELKKERNIKQLAAAADPPDPKPERKDLAWYEAEMKRRYGDE